jgi:hypothetical protein
MIIRIGDIIHSSINDIMNSYLSCVPNLKQFSIHLAIFDSRIVELYLDYDWLKIIILNGLPLLQKFRFYIYFCNLIDLTREPPEVSKSFSVGDMMVR